MTANDLEIGKCYSFKLDLGQSSILIVYILLSHNKQERRYYFLKSDGIFGSFDESSKMHKKSVLQS